MNTEEIIQKFKSKDVHSILDAVWWILDCTDKILLNELQPHIKDFRKEVRNINLGGMFYKNSDNFELAMSYIKSFCSGECRCNLYIKTQKFSPEMEAKRNYISILNINSLIELFEVQFEVERASCKRRLKVREVHGWHVPWYEWKLVEQIT